MKKARHVVLGVTASVAIYKACDLVRRLREAGFLVSVVMTKEAAELVRPALFQSLSSNKVYCGLFEEASAWEIEHVALAERADVLLIAPATANIIAKIACGICDDLLTCVVAAAASPVVLCPAMNDRMYRNKITQENIKKLRSLGYTLVGPKEGRLACGRVAVGCLADVETIVRQVKNILA